MNAVARNSFSRSVVETIVRQVVTERLARSAQTVVPVLAVHVSARHMHLCRADLEKLFGPGHELTPDRPLYQEGHFAAKETVTLIGPRSRLISNLRILGPLRDRSQIELAFTDAISLGLDNVPIRLSGDITGTPGAFVMGPSGLVELKEGVIRAAMHVHMNPTEAKHHGVRHGDRMKLRVGGDAGVTFENVHVRVDPRTRLNVHMDTDEANACGLHLAQRVELFRQEQIQ
ncbi:MAG: phosphate propanoyltransferase [Vicinamibacteria bacterium]|nr:phosphate propanoyltransferase [Vicinamibacteria bacterium]